MAAILLQLAHSVRHDHILQLRKADGAAHVHRILPSGLGLRLLQVLAAHEQQDLRLRGLGLGLLQHFLCPFKLRQGLGDNAVVLVPVDPILPGKCVQLLFPLIFGLECPLQRLHILLVPLLQLRKFVTKRLDLGLHHCLLLHELLVGRRRPCSKKLLRHFRVPPLEDLLRRFGSHVRDPDHARVPGVAQQQLDDLVMLVEHCPVEGRASLLTT
mmetsp:Transcript_39849/g.71365  ORF Transcript_39849/g.71365 Transcript_39849/m.71365 type:complete len:213 (-) Transcript_39849:294-932(-)